MVLKVCLHEWLSGGVSPCQGEGRGFESRLVLFLFAEKDKKLFYITRSTKNGRLQSGIAKIAALFVHCTIITILFYGMNLIYAEITIGFGDLTADIQSVAIYMESNLQISILEYIIYSVLTKGFVFFATGNVIMAFCIFADRIVLPYVAAFLLYGISYIAYLTIPAVEKWSVFKYINLIGILETQKLYGSYLNFNIGCQLLIKRNAGILGKFECAFEVVDIHRPLLWVELIMYNHNCMV